MSKLQKQVADFHVAMGQVDETPPHDPSQDVRMKRALICIEEFMELGVALVGAYDCRRICSEMVDKVTKKRGFGGQGGLVEIADACSDSSVVVTGTLLECGIFDDPLNDEVMRSNMAKEGGEVDEWGKFQKPPGWTPPDIEGVLRAQGWDGR